MTGGAVGSIFAQFFHLSSAERKTLLVAGAAGGMAAIFASPVAAALLAIELLLFEWRPRSFIPVAIAAATAAALRVPLLGAGPIFSVHPHASLGGEGLFFAFIVGTIAGLGSGLLTTMVYGFEDLFNKLPFHWMWWPAIGGLCVGIGGLIEPSVLGVGYETIYRLLRGDIVGPALLSILLGKSLVWSIALRSGTSGGVLAPLLMMGGALGAALAQLIPLGDSGLWALIGMAAMMGGTMRSPLTAMIFTLELTQDLNLLPGLLVGCIAAHGVTVLLLRRSILTEKVARRGFHVMREYSVDPLTLVRVGEVMDKDAVIVRANMPLIELSDRIARHEPEVSRHQGLLIADENGHLTGIITRGDIVHALEQNGHNDGTVAMAGSRDLVVTFPDEVLHEAAIKMLRNNRPITRRQSSRRASDRRLFREKQSHGRPSAPAGRRASSRAQISQAPTEGIEFTRVKLERDDSWLSPLKELDSMEWKNRDGRQSNFCQARRNSRKIGRYFDFRASIPAASSCRRNSDAVL